MSVSHNIYVHVPFCVSKCKYCAFFSHAVVAPDWETYSNNIIAEIKHWGDLLGHCDVPTIFFGGGTPSLMPNNIFDKIICCIAQNFHITENCEITLESNPGTLDEQKLDNFIVSGVNRVSVGIQSLNDDELKFLGRKHDVKTAMNFLDMAQKKNIHLNADFIYGLPGQTTQNIITLCKNINTLGLNHVSLYELTIEPTTPFGKMNLDMPDNDTMANMYCAISDTLDLPRYEVSNYANLDYECQHNKNIWNGEPYVGFGRGAAGRPYFDGLWHEQLGNNEKCDVISEHNRAIEKIITGMRTKTGITISADIDKILNYDFIANNSDLIHFDNNRIFATDTGFLVLDNIIQNLVK